MSGMLAHAAYSTLARGIVHAAQHTTADVHTETCYTFGAKPDEEYGKHQNQSPQVYVARPGRMMR